MEGSTDTFGTIALLTRFLIFHTRFFFEDFEENILCDSFCFLNDTEVFEDFGSKIVLSDLAMKTDETV